MKFVCVLSIIGTVLIASCTTPHGDRRPEGRVVERSKQSRPLWADAPVNQLDVNATETKFHYALLKQPDLPIAVRAAQTDAVEATYTPWRASFDKRIDEFPKIPAARNSRNEAEYKALIETVARKVHTQAAQVEDIYYERIAIDNPAVVPELKRLSEYFDVHVIVQLNPVERDRLQTVLYHYFSNARSPDLKKAVKDLAPTPVASTKPSKPQKPRQKK